MHNKEEGDSPVDNEYTQNYLVNNHRHWFRQDAAVQAIIIVTITVLPGAWFVTEGKIN